MANIVVTSSNDLIFVDFGVYAGTDGLPKKKVYEKSKVYMAILQVSDAYVSILVEGDTQWNLVYTATTGYLIVDSVDGATPTMGGTSTTGLTTALPATAAAPGTVTTSFWGCVS